MSEPKLSKAQLRAVQQHKLQVFFEQSTADAIINQLYRQLFADPDYLNSQLIGVTLSMAGELNTAPIISYSKQQHKQIAVPRTLPKRQMEFVLLEADTQFVTTPFGTTEPKGGHVVDKTSLDALIVPGLAFAKNHYRVGFGGGFYDRYLAGFSGKSISLALPPQLYETPIWPTEAHDMLIDKLIY
ncbi:5-formyltetrahydrofolate cyclo-ligase [Lentilactobacillus fungorum]|uniref:5-formyltetrahydrofolate cyclo-ligase n=1 Tax=Lentilactobacillus fungorum TaxID=2201250 RepID=A0ABQ3VVH8_9LACO|nr:5-formyltetrahydrofolate cyclo-ligase [Lentilactobacillus fungorum]GHP12888.1 5-formyltetrahydrofolate cyclo-ligase [Lentilactobacillus fungorum]